MKVPTRGRYALAAGCAAALATLVVAVPSFAGGNKATAIDSDVSATNRFLIFMYPSKEASDKVQNEIIKPWAEKVKGKYTDRYRIFGVEAAEMK